MCDMYVYNTFELRTQPVPQNLFRFHIRLFAEYTTMKKWNIQKKS